MKETRNDWTDRLPDLMQDFTEAAPEGLWDAVRAGSAPARRRSYLWWGPALAMAAALAALFVLWPSAPEADVRPVPADAVAQAQPGEPGEPAQPTEQPEQQNITASQTVIAPAKQETFEPAGQKPDVPKENVTAMTEEPKPEIAATEEEPEQKTAVTAGPVKQEERQPVPAKPAPEPIRPVQPSGRVRPERERKPVRIQPTVSVGGLIAQAGPTTTHGYGIPNPSFTKSAGISSSDKDLLMMASRNKASETEENHSQGTGIFLGMDIGLGGPWSLETGLVENTLNYTCDTRTASQSVHFRRTTYYLGIPLNLKVSLWQKKHWELYVSAGPMYEFAIRTTTSDEGRISFKDDVWSLNAAAGFQVRLTSAIGFFVQPGLSWHIPDGSETATYYTEHPFSPRFNIGLRYTIK